MDSLSRTLNRLPGMILQVVISLGMLYLVYLGWTMVGGPSIDLFAIWEDRSEIINDFREQMPTGAAFWVVLVIGLILATMVVKAPWKYGIYLIVVALMASWLSSCINRTEETLDRGINHGDWSEPSDYVRKVRGGTIHIAQNGFERALFSGTVKVVDKGQGQCLHVQADEETISSWSGNRLAVEDLDGDLMYTISWNRNAKEFTLTMIEEEMLSISTKRFGEDGCAPIRL